MGSGGARMDIDCEQHHASLAVSDVAAAVEFYTKNLGFWVAFAEGDPPTFAGVNLGGVQIFLHTHEPLGDGVASPHTKRTIAYIQELKRKHGIDYDSHASYRFRE